MMHITRCRFFLVGVLLLSGCRQEPLDDAYLMTHPDSLEQEVSRCQAETAETPTCAVVRQAATNFSALVYERANHPEGFGKQILTAQTKLAELQEAATTADHGTNTAFQQELAQQRQHVAVLLAVVAATTGASL